MPDSALLLLQLSVILVIARLFAALLGRLGQPAVLGEMAAGVALGPAMLGNVWPALEVALFPARATSALSALATLGLVLFMFILGLETSSGSRGMGKVRRAACIGCAGLVGPVLLGLAVAAALPSQMRPAGVSTRAFSAFVAVALSITAFPVLARILVDRGLTRTVIGQVALESAALVDVLAWCLLATLTLMCRSPTSGHDLVPPGVGWLIVSAGIFLAARVCGHLLSRQSRILPCTPATAREDFLAARSLRVLLPALLAVAALCDALHLHAAIGAFLFGALLPHDEATTRGLAQRLSPLCTGVLLPAFFVLAGLGITRDAFGGGSASALVLVVLAASVGKIGGAALAARWTGLDWRDSLGVGVLLNTRGLMELIAIRIGLDAGLIGPPMFSVLLGMAWMTTAMTGPLLAGIEMWRTTHPRPAEPGEPAL